MEKLLNKLLADLVVEYHKLQHFHWYVKGGDFFTVHAQLEKMYDEINEAVDEVAEIMLQCKMKPASSMKEFLKLTGIKEATGSFTASATMASHKVFTLRASRPMNLSKATLRNFLASRNTSRRSSNRLTKKAMSKR